MPSPQTRCFGAPEYRDEAALLFPRGLPGFESCRRFVLREDPALAPLLHLQSIDVPELCFIALPVDSIDPGYQLWLAEEDRALLPEGEPVLVLALLSGSAGEGWSANLLAPVVIHLATRVAVQAVRGDRRYSHQQRLAEGGTC